MRFVSIIAVIIIGAGLDKTGVMNKVAKPILALAGRSEAKIMLLVSSTVGVISSMMQNIGAAAPVFARPPRESPSGWGFPPPAS